LVKFSSSISVSTLYSFRGIYHKTDVAIKRVHSRAVTEKLMEEFVAEAELMNLIPPHPHLVLFRGVTLPPDPWTIVVNYCNGGSLYAYLHKQDKLEDSVKLSFATDIAKGMVHLHFAIDGVEIIHRDLAARNILLSDGRALVSDFGMARLKESNEDASKTQSVVGPLKWMAPESLRNQQYSRKSDVFSYGVLLYEIVTQADPWPSMNPVAATVQILNGERMAIPDDCPKTLRELMIKCWDNDPQKRPEFTEICDVLLEHQEVVYENLPSKEEENIYNKTPGHSDEPVPKQDEE